MCSRNYIIIIVFTAVVVISKSLSGCNFFGLLLVQWERHPKSRLLEVLQSQGGDGCGGIEDDVCMHVYFI